MQIHILIKKNTNGKLNTHKKKIQMTPIKKYIERKTHNFQTKKRGTSNAHEREIHKA